MVSRRSDREPDRETSWWHACGGAALAALMWLPPLIDQIRNEPGNLSALLHSGTGEGKRAGIGFALRLLSENLGLPPAWAGRDVAQVTARLTPSWVAPVLILIPIGALFMAVRDRSLPGFRALTVAGALPVVPLWEQRLCTVISTGISCLVRTSDRCAGRYE